MIKNHVSRRQLLRLGVLFAAAGVVGEARWIEPRFLQRTRYAVGLGPKPSKVGGAASKGTEPLRVMHISDLHHGRDTPIQFIEEAFSLGLRDKPDVVVITGDVIDREIVAHRELIDLLRRVVAIAPTYATMGNHDGGAWAARYRGYADSGRVRSLVREAGVKVLHNEGVQIEVSGRGYNLVGLGDSWADECEPDRAFGLCDPTASTIVLSHNPDTKDLLGAYEWQLMLSGHTHGGQLRIPLSGEAPFAPVKDKRFVAGLNEWSNRLIHTSRGVATTAKLRFNCRPEVTTLDIL